MQDPLLIPELREYITDNKTETLKAFFEKTTPAVAADPEFIFDLPDRGQSVRFTAEDTRGLTFDALDPAPSM